MERDTKKNAGYTQKTKYICCDSFLLLDNKLTLLATHNIHHFTVLWIRSLSKT